MNKYEKALKALKEEIFENDGFITLESQEASALLQELIDKDKKGILYLCGYCGEYTYRRYHKTYDVGCPWCGKEGTFK